MTAPDAFNAVKAALDEAGIATVSAEVTKIPQNTIKVEGKQAESVLKVMDYLDDIDDVQQVYANFDMDEEE